MSEKKKASTGGASSPERTLLTLDQLSQTIDVMSSVVNRLRSHLSEQIAAAQAMPSQPEQLQQPTQPQALSETADAELGSAPRAKLENSSLAPDPRFIVEIKGELDLDTPETHSRKTLH